MRAADDQSEDSGDFMPSGLGGGPDSELLLILNRIALAGLNSA
jgi:hypothetical protein